MVIRNVEKKDIDFVANLIQKQAESGHFNPDFNTTTGRKSLEHQISTTIDKERMGIGLITNATKVSQIYIFEKDGQAVAFCWLSGFAESDEYANEIYMFAVKKEFRKRGIGDALIDYAMKKTLAKSEMHARIYFKSTFMKALIIKKGFKKSKCTATATEYFTHKKTNDLFLCISKYIGKFTRLSMCISI